MNLPERSPLCDSHREEVASLLTHSLGVVLSVAALVWMLIESGGEALKMVSALVFGVALILLYTSSSLYHLFTSLRWKAHFQTLDHICIYLLIAGSYTPITLVALQGTWGWSLFGTVWALAASGIAVKLRLTGKKDHWLSTALYLAMGWLVILAIKPLIQRIAPEGMWLLVAGGLSYSLGIVFFLWEKLPFNHAIWHLFVLGGSVCHVVAVAGYVL
ncbi:MAG: hemolysin III family protein [Luteolibacter sp.]